MKIFFFLIGVCIFLGAITKRAQFPFSAWLPHAMAAPTPVSSLVHSSTLVTAGVYIVIRINSIYCLNIYSDLLLFVSLITVILSGFAAISEFDLKKIIALSTLSQLGVIIIILSFGLPLLSFFHLIIHAIFKAILFLCAGVLIHGMFGIQDLRLFSMGIKVSPSIIIIIILSNLCLSGFPFLGGFYSKDLILETFYFYNNNIIIMFILVISVILTIMYSVRLIYYCVYNNSINLSFQGFFVSNFISFPIYLMGFSIIFFGSVLGWIIFPNPEIFILNFFSKKFTFILILNALALIIFLILLNNLINFNFILNFQGNLYYLSDIRRIFFSKNLKIGKHLYVLDQRWVEILFPQKFFF